MSAYQSIIDVLAHAAEEPEASAIEIVQALRNMPAEVAQAGVDRGQWEKASGAMIAIAVEADVARRARRAEVRRAQWPDMKHQLELSGCKVTNRDCDRWHVIGTGVSINIDLRTGDVQHSDDELGEQLPEFEHITDHIVWSVASRQASIADLARRTERRKTHRWDNKKKVWLPRSGVGPVIKGGD